MVPVAETFSCMVKALFMELIRIKVATGLVLKLCLVCGVITKRRNTCSRLWWVEPSQQLELSCLLTLSPGAEWERVSEEQTREKLWVEMETV